MATLVVLPAVVALPPLPAARGALAPAHGGPLGPRAEFRLFGVSQDSPRASSKRRPKHRLRCVWANQVALERDLTEAEDEAARAADEARGASLVWGARDTLYFHLLTGGVGSKVKVVGDMLAWGAGRKELRGLAARRRQLQGKDSAPERGDADVRDAAND